ncbi:large exoproteins [alpha proteobacterium U9-1i]|nr:large exoproteins [alpha proteobacterium U9-1i]
MIRRTTLIAVEIVLGLAAALLIGLGVAWWRLSQGPLDLSFIKQHVQAELSQTRSGRPVGLERVELAWSTQANALELRAVGVTVEDGRGAVLMRSEEARIELAVLPLLIGRVSLVAADFNGGDITLTRKVNGAVHIAFGPPGAPADIIIPPPPANETAEQRVARVLDGMAATFRPVGAGGQLRHVTLRNARLQIVDEGGGGRWSADSAILQLDRDGDALTLAAEALLEAATGAAPARLSVTTDTGFQAALIEFGATDVRPRALLSQAALGPFANIDTPLTANIAIGLDRQSGINRLEGDITLGRGSTATADGRFSLDGGRIHGRYDIASDELIIDQLQMAGDSTRVRGEIRVRDASSIMRADANAPAAFSISMPALTLDVPGTFAKPVNLTHFEATGAINTQERAIEFTRVTGRVDDGAVSLNARLYWADIGEGEARRSRMGVQLDGAVTGTVSVQDVLAFWPVGLGEGTRSYLARSLTGGRVSGVTARLDIRPGEAAPETPMRQEAVDVRFNVADGEMRFIETMSPITNARGSAVLRGNSFEMTIPEARMNGLAITNGRISAPRLKPRGDWLTISARAEGEARPMMELLLQEPLSMRERLPVDVATATGRGRVDLRLQRPNLREAPFEQWRYTIDGHLDNFAGTMTGRRVALANGRLQIRGDQRAISVSGPIRAGQSDVDVRWTEFLNRRGRASSEYQISGDFDARDLERLGYSIARYAQGRVGVVISGEGRGFDVNNANLEVDLRAASVSSPWSFWTKNAGEAASIRLDMARQTDGAMLFQNIDARGAGLVAQGSVRVGRDESILAIDMPRLAVEGRADARVAASRAADGGLDIQVRGALFDAAPFMEDSEPVTARRVTAARVEPPVRANLQVDRLKMRGGATLSNARVQVMTYRNALAMLVAEGNAPSGRSFSLGLGPRPGDPSGRIALRSDDAGFAVRALTGSENIVGGTATADGEWRTGPPSTARFNVRMRNFQVVRLPAMARLLSSAGSLTGMVEMLNGDGIGFSNMEAQMSYANDRLTFEDGSMRGPSLGLTASGNYDIERDNLDVDGVVAPSFGLNSLLGNVPLVGNLFVSRQGEGVVGMTYSINGAAGEPRVGVNPLSALTPGIFRRIFEPTPQRDASTGGAHSAPPEPAPLPVEPEAPAPEIAPMPVAPTLQESSFSAPSAQGDTMVAEATP